MAHSVVTLIIIIAFAGIGAGFLRLATARAARARERAGLPARVRVKLPLYYLGSLDFAAGDKHGLFVLRFSPSKQRVELARTAIGAIAIDRLNNAVTPFGYSSGS